MKYFICNLEGTSLGIPAEQTGRVISAPRLQAAVYETENHEAFISLPVLFRLKDITAPHGIILKTSEREKEQIKTVLLTPRIDIELEIPEENIHALPEALQGPFQYFRGVYFADKNVILILDPEKLKGRIK